MSKPFSNLANITKPTIQFFPLSVKDREECNRYKHKENFKGKVARDILAQDRISMRQMSILHSFINWDDLSKCNFTEQEYSDEDYQISAYDLCVDGNG